MTTAFWIADQAGYVNEAIVSAESFKRHNPECLTVLFGTNDRGFDIVYPLPQRFSEMWYLNSVRYFENALHTIRDDRLIYFDTDTYTLAPLDALIALIGRFDLIGAHAPARVTAPTVQDLPDAFPEINIGVLGIANNDVMKRFVSEWFIRAEMYQATYGNNDQASLRETLWQSPVVNAYIMPPEYNCRFGFGGFAALPVCVLHGRGMSFEAAAQVVNSRAGMRAWYNADLHG